MELPALGNHCSQSACSKLDFLPFNCHKCHKVFCEDHYKASTHTCGTAAFEDARSHKCPLCRQQLAVRRGEDPNVTVERHIAQGCQTGKAKTGGISSACTFKGCKKKELVPMTVRTACCCDSWLTTKLHVKSHAPVSESAKSAVNSFVSSIGSLMIMLVVV
eukprot:m.90431 g.90431  ORF g.90431 m.90431 type:complete len:161 (-) comp14882_c0_seq3:20-502(-)